MYSPDIDKIIDSGRNDSSERSIIKSFSSEKAGFRDNIATLQESVQKISKRIEVDKINLNILQERNNKKKSEYYKLAGKPIIKTKEQKLRDIREKMEKLKNRHIFDPKYGKKTIVLKKHEENSLILRNTDRCKVELNNLISSINKEKIVNVCLSNEIDEVRREKTLIFNKIHKIKEENKKIEKSVDLFQIRNNNIEKKIDYKELIKQKERGKTLENEFLEKRDFLEEKFHKVIEENIRREREHKNDLRELRLKNAVFADKIRNQGLNRLSKSMVINDIKLSNDDQIHDRIPILSVLVEKWKYITKQKKNIIDRYSKHASEIRFSFNKLLLFLGIEDVSQLPEIFEKNEEQTNEVEKYLSSISTEVDILTGKKNLLEKQIITLNKAKEKDKKEKINLLEERQSKIESLKKQNDVLIKKIKKKIKIYEEIEKPTFDFLKKLQNTYLQDFVVNKNTVEENTKLNENNIIDYLGTVFCYCQLIKDFDESTRENKKRNLIEINDNNKSIEFLKRDIKLKLSKINFNNCVTDNINKSIRNVVKHGNDFDGTIKRLANIIVDQVNNNGELSLNNISNLNTNFLDSSNNPV